MEKGIVILDKPAGMTSWQATEEVRKKLKAKKAGHAGTLDPGVTGVLLIALNRATKLMPLFERLDKCYEGKAHLHKDVKLEKLKKVIKKFVGKIKQIPPRKSRVARVEREREIYEFKALKKKGKDFWFKVCCEAGTYIRKLIHDLGKEIGGAHMVELRRIAQGPFSVDEAIKLENLSTKNVIPAEKAVEKVSPIIFISVNALEKLKQGKFLLAKEITKTKGGFERQVVAAFCKNEIVALVKPFFSSKNIKTQKGFVLKPERII